MSDISEPHSEIISNVKSNRFNKYNTHRNVRTDSSITTNFPIIEPLYYTNTTIPLPKSFLKPRPSLLIQPFPILSSKTKLVRIPSIFFSFPKDDKKIEFIILVGPEVHGPIIYNNDTGHLQDVEEVSLHIGIVLFKNI